METQNRWFWLPVLILALCLVLPPPVRASEQEALRVGRIAYVEGSILRYVPDLDDWVAATKDAPAGMSDVFFSDAAAHAELDLPNLLRTRIGGDTQIQLVALNREASEIEVSTGVVRFYNKSSNGVLKATTPFGYVQADRESAFDLYVGDQSVEIVNLGGEVHFISPANDSTPVIAGIMADAKQIVPTNGDVDAEWDDWNAARDADWNTRAGRGVSTARNVPPQIRDDAYTLEENGKWERVYYEGGYRELWRPTVAAASWQPFTVGRWTEWNGDQCWVPDEPFGYVTHHYGNWVSVNGAWYWAPPAATAAVSVDPPWYPGRVAWIYDEADVGWVPLAPTEVYYANNYWGPQAVVMDTAPAVAVDIGGLAFYRAAVIVPQAEFYSVPSYTSVRVTNINQTTIVNNFHSSRVVNDTVVRGYSQTADRHKFTNAPVFAKPHNDATLRTRTNRQLASENAKTVNAANLRNSLSSTRRIEPSKQVTIPPPKAASRFVPTNQANAPKTQTPVQPADLKKATRPAAASTAATKAPGGPAAHGAGPVQSGVQAGKTAVPASAQPGVPPQTPGSQGGKTGSPTPASGMKAPGTQQPGTPGVQPPKTGQQPAAPGGQTLQPGGPGARPPGQPAQPAQPPTAPSKSAVQTLEQRGSGKAGGLQGPQAPSPGAQPPVTSKSGVQPPAPAPSGTVRPAAPAPAPTQPGAGKSGGHATTQAPPATGRQGVSSTPSAQQPGMGRPGPQTQPGGKSFGPGGQPHSTVKPGGPASPSGQQPGMGGQGMQPPRATQQQPRPQQQAPAVQQRPQQQAPAVQQRPQQQAPAVQKQSPPPQPKQQQQQQQKKKPGEQ